MSMTCMLGTIPTLSHPNTKQRSRAGSHDSQMAGCQEHATVKVQHYTARSSCTMLQMERQGPQYLTEDPHLAQPARPQAWGMAQVCRQSMARLVRNSEDITAPCGAAGLTRCCAQTAPSLGSLCPTSAPAQQDLKLILSSLCLFNLSAGGSTNPATPGTHMAAELMLRSPCTVSLELTAPVSAPLITAGR